MLYVNDTLIQTGHFPDKTSNIKFDVFLANGKPIKIIWLYDNDEELVNLIYLTRHIQTKGYTNITLIMPYIPNARLDRIKNNRDVFTLKWFAETINNLKFKNVVVLDPHSHVSEALIDNLTIVSPEEIILDVLDTININNKDLVLFFPDEGAMKRYVDIATKNHIPYVFASKNRDWLTGEIKGLTINSSDPDMLTGKNILIIDDICSKGGTFYHSAKALKEKNVNNIYLYVSHCENTVFAGDLYSENMVNKIFTTNSIFRPDDKDIKSKIIVFDVADYIP